MAALRLAAVLCLGSAAVASFSYGAPEPWTLVHCEQSVDYYLSKGTVRTQGKFVTYWILVNFNYDPKFDGAEPYKPALILRYANCATREQDTKSYFQYHAPMGQGEPTYALTFDDATIHMEAAQPGSVGAEILAIASSLNK